MFEILGNPQSLRLLYSLLDGERSLDELSSILGMSKPGIKQKYLDRLEMEGLVKKTIVKTKVGRQARYKLEPLTIVFSMDPITGTAIRIADRSRIDLNGILLQQVDPQFRKDVDRFIKALDKSLLDECTIILFGSVAIGKGTRKSDIDLLFLRSNWDDGKDIIERAEEDVSLSVDHQISPVTLSIQQFLTQDSIFIKEIKREGIIIWGSLERGGELWHQMKRYSSIST